MNTKFSTPVVRTLILIGLALTAPAWVCAQTPPPSPAPRGANSGSGGRRGAGKQDPETLEGPAGTGAHCILPKGNLLYVDVPPARAVFAINKESWEVDHMWPVVGNRPHDMVWADAAKTRIWVADSNMNSFILHDAETGAPIEQVKLPAGSPVIHGAKLYNGYMYMCDDQGWMSRVKW